MDLVKIEEGEVSTSWPDIPRPVDPPSTSWPPAFLDQLAPCTSRPVGPWDLVTFWLKRPVDQLALDVLASWPRRCVDQLVSLRQPVDPSEPRTSWSPWDLVKIGREGAWASWSRRTVDQLAPPRFLDQLAPHTSRPVDPS